MDIIDAAVIPDSIPPFAQDHARRYRDSKGKEGHRSIGGSYPEAVQNVPSLLLATEGRESGKRMLFPLFYGEDNGRYVVVASKGGSDEDPGWYENIVEEPAVRIQVGERRLDAVASTASGAERERLWKLMQGVWDGFTEYQDMTDREIPVVVLTPRPH